MDQYDPEQYYLRGRVRQQLNMAAVAVGKESQFNNHTPTILFSEPVQHQSIFPHHQNLPSSIFNYHAPYSEQNNYHATPPSSSYNSSVLPDHHDHHHDELVQLCHSTTTTTAINNGTYHPDPPPAAAGVNTSAGMMLMYRRNSGDLKMETGSSSTADCITGRWSRQETLCLLEIRARLDPEFREIAAVAGTNGGHNKKGPLWDQASRMMGEQHGYQRSGKKCKEKFENLYKYYRKTKELSAKSTQHGNVNKQQHYRFFNQLEALCARKNSYPDCNINEPPSSSLVYRSTDPSTSTNYYPEDQVGGHHPNYGTDDYQGAQRRVYEDKSISLSYPFDQVLGYDHQTTSSPFHCHHDHLSINNSNDDDDDDGNNNGDHDDDISTVVLKAKKRQSLDHDQKKNINKKRISTDHHDEDTQTSIMINNYQNVDQCAMKRELQDHGISNDDCEKMGTATSSMEEVIENCLDSHMTKLMEKQEAWMEKMLNTIEHNERDRMIKEDQWRKIKLTRNYDLG